jgi:hypothetical protein
MLLLTETSPSQTLEARFARLVMHLRRVTSARIALGLAYPLAVLIDARLRGLGVRLAALLVRYRAGTLRPPRPRRRPAGPAKPPPALPPTVLPPDAAAAVAPVLRLPRGFGWFNRLVPASSGYALLQSQLSDPEVAALMAAAPQVGRLLRPLCHMLGLAVPELLRLPPRPRRRPPPPRSPPPRSPRPSPPRSGRRRSGAEPPSSPHPSGLPPRRPARRTHGPPADRG